MIKIDKESYNHLKCLFAKRETNSQNELVVQLKKQYLVDDNIRFIVDIYFKNKFEDCVDFMNRNTAFDTYICAKISVKSSTLNTSYHIKENIFDKNEDKLFETGFEDFHSFERDNFYVFVQERRCKNFVSMISFDEYLKHRSLNSSKSNITALVR